MKLLFYWLNNKSHWIRNFYIWIWKLFPSLQKIDSRDTYLVYYKQIGTPYTNLGFLWLQYIAIISWSFLDLTVVFLIFGSGTKKWIHILLHIVIGVLKLTKCSCTKHKCSTVCNESYAIVCIYLFGNGLFIYFVIGCSAVAMVWKYALLGTAVCVAAIAYWLYIPIPDGYSASSAMQMRLFLAPNKVIDLLVCVLLISFVYNFASRWILLRIIC